MQAPQAKYAALKRHPAAASAPSLTSCQRTKFLRCWSIVLLLPENGFRSLCHWVFAQAQAAAFSQVLKYRV